VLGISMERSFPRYLLVWLKKKRETGRGEREKGERW